MAVPPPPPHPLVLLAPQPPACATLFPTDRIPPPSPIGSGVVFYRDAANYHCKRPMPVKVAKRMGFRYDFQKKEKKNREREGEREGTKSEEERGEGYKSPWSPIKFMNPDLDRSPIVTVLKYFFSVIRYLFSFSPPPLSISTNVSTICSIEYAILQLAFGSSTLKFYFLKTL